MRHRIGHQKIETVVDAETADEAASIAQALNPKHNVHVVMPAGDAREADVPATLSR